MLQKNPRFGRLAPRLVLQLVPAVIVSTVGIVMLTSLGKSPDPLPAETPAVTVIQGEAMVRVVPRETEVAETDKAAAKAAAPRAAKPKTAAAKEPAQQQRKVAATEPWAPAPDQPPPAPAAAPPAAAKEPATPDSGNFIVSGWRRVTGAAERAAQWVQPPSSWFERSPPPRPPAPIPERNFAGVSL